MWYQNFEKILWLFQGDDKMKADTLLRSEGP